MHETDKHREAFECFYETANKSEVARRFKVSLQSVNKWAKVFKWHERVSNRNKEIIGQTNEKLGEELSNERVALYKITKNLLATAFTKDESGAPVLAIAIANVSDFERVTKLMLLIQGEPERVDLTTGGEKIRDPTDIRDDIKEYANVLNRLATERAVRDVQKDNS